MTKARAVSNGAAAKGDIVAGSGTNTSAVLGVGTDGQVLTATSANTTGLGWATPSSGSLTLLSTTTLSGTTTAITGISQSYTNLFLLFNGISTSSTSSILLYPNQVSNITDWAGLSNFANTINTIGSVGSNIQLTSAQLGGNTSSTAALLIYNYASASYLKSISWVSRYTSAQTTSQSAITSGGGINTTSAISSISITTGAGTYTLGGQVLIYGVK